MRFEEHQLRQFLLEGNIEVIPAAIVAESLRGTAQAAVATMDDGVRLDGTATLEKWNDIQQRLAAIPESVMEVDTNPSESGNVEFQITLHDTRLTEDETNGLVRELRNRWDIRVPYSETFREEIIAGED